ncbi:ABC transporter substrate-binding protein [Kineococcus auxinigenes]|uniref:ABC transporter substrate-binding protein n=1 Tax=unclassified Kineococcus TaxID=2621656 RepID=UPI003D7C9034
MSAQVPLSHPSRRTVAAGGAASLLALLTGCGAGSSSSPAPAASATADVAQGGSAFRTADSATAALGSGAPDGEFPRTLTHAAGSTTIERRPQRVVVLDTGELDAVLSLGVTPVGMGTTAGQTGLPSHLAEQVDGRVETVGPLDQIDLEAVAALRPDLVLGSALRVQELYPQLSQIAPTVLSHRPGFPWKENLLLAGDALGVRGEAEALLTDYQERADALRAELGATPPTISLVRFMPGRIRLYGDLSFIGVVLGDVGLPRPAEQDVDDLAVEVSAETITRADGDRLFYTSYGPVDATEEAAVLSGPLWSTIPAVAQGRAQRVDDETWFLGLGYSGAVRVLDDLARHLTA